MSICLSVYIKELILNRLVQNKHFNNEKILQISATALEETKILVWHRDKLKLILTMSDPFLKTVLDHVVARDVVRKLTQVSDTQFLRF
jgi:hypothetical protein